MSVQLRYYEQSVRDIIHLARVAAWKQTQHLQEFFCSNYK